MSMTMILGKTWNCDYYTKIDTKYGINLREKSYILKTVLKKVLQGPLFLIINKVVKISVIKKITYSYQLGK